MMSQDTAKRAPVGTVGKKKKQRSDARIKWTRCTNFPNISRTDDELLRNPLCYSHLDALKVGG
jgi:hypothetical protein